MLKAPPQAVAYVRMSHELKARLQECAAQNHRSLNGEILKRLNASLYGYKVGEGYKR